MVLHSPALPTMHGGKFVYLATATPVAAYPSAIRSVHTLQTARPHNHDVFTFHALMHSVVLVSNAGTKVLCQVVAVLRLYCPVALAGAHSQSYVRPERATAPGPIPTA